VVAVFRDDGGDATERVPTREPAEGWLTSALRGSLAGHLFLLPARHYVQVDAPATVAMLLRSLRLKPVMSRDAKRDGQAG